jgi:hypothetical protein
MFDDEEIGGYERDPTHSVAEHRHCGEHEPGGTPWHAVSFGGGARDVGLALKASGGLIQGARPHTLQAMNRRTGARRRSLLPSSAGTALGRIGAIPSAGHA